MLDFFTEVADGTLHEPLGKKIERAGSNCFRAEVDEVVKALTNEVDTGRFSLNIYLLKFSDEINE